MFTRFTNGAEQEIEEAFRYQSNAEEEADAVYAYKNNAEVEVWRARQDMYTYLQNDVREYNVASIDKATTMYDIQKGAVEYLYVETKLGDYVNPTIKFTYSGGAWNGNSYIVAGTLYVYGIGWDGKEKSSMQANLGAIGDITSGTVETTLSGDFSNVGIKLYLRDSSNESDMYYVELTLSEITVDGKRYVAK